MEGSQLGGAATQSLIMPQSALEMGTSRVWTLVSGTSGGAAVAVVVVVDVLVVVVSIVVLVPFTVELVTVGGIGVRWVIFVIRWVTVGGVVVAWVPFDIGGVAADGTGDG